MVATTSSNKLNSLVEKLRRDYPEINFGPADMECWSAVSKTVSYNPSRGYKLASFGLLHELSHALLDHKDYGSDFDLLQMEVLAWNSAAELGAQYNITIDKSHIQECLDTYRNWLFSRSRCPACSMVGSQNEPSRYTCPNCATNWKVGDNPFKRTYRLGQTKNRPA